MNKAADIYWDKPKAIRRNSDRNSARPQIEAAARTATPRWLSFVLIALVTSMLCLAINYRSFTELRSEVNENQNLRNQIQNLTDENLMLQEEIHNLKSDPKTIEREARKLGLGRSNEKSLVPAN